MTKFYSDENKNIIKNYSNPCIITLLLELLTLSKPIKQ